MTTTMFKNNFKTIFLALGLGLVLTACAGSSSAPTIEDGVITPQVGTTTGNPSIPIKQSLVFASEDSQATTQNDPDVMCRPLDNEDNAGLTQRCFLTPQSFAIGVLAIYAVECTDAQTLAVPCDSPEVFAVAKRVELYRQDATKAPIEIKITNGEVAFPEALATITDSVHAGGLQFVLANMTYGFPDSPAVSVDLRGVPALVCSTPDDASDAAIKHLDCGNEGAERGDILFDPMRTSDFVFFADPWQADRPENYDSLMGFNPINEETIHYLTPIITPNPEFTTDFYGVDGYFAPIFPLSETLNFPLSAGVEYKVIFNLTNTLTFVDGWQATSDHRLVCVQQLSAQACPVDADPHSVGVYDIRYDGAFKPKPPHVHVGVTAF